MVVLLSPSHQVARIVSVELLANSEKLYKLQVDLGSEKRQVGGGGAQTHARVPCAPMYTYAAWLCEAVSPAFRTVQAGLCLGLGRA